MRDYVFFYLNGQPREIRGEAALQMLSDYLRYESRLPGTKVVCAEGDCGACSVLRRHPLGESRPGFEAINSCITTLAQMDGSSLVTVEALAEEGLTPVQQAMVQCHGSQCGFCTPGFVVTLTGLVEKKMEKGLLSPLTEREAKNALTGNLCRCTGYRPILDAALAVDLKKTTKLSPHFYSSAIQKKLKAIVKEPVWIKGSVFAPTSGKDAAKYLGKSPKTRLLGAGTDLGVLVNKNKLRYSEVLSLHLIPDLYAVKKKGGRLRVGARVTLATLRRATKESIPELSRFLDLFASPQIKNVATLVGNLVNASPIADTPPFLLVAGTTIHAVGPKGSRTIPIENFFLGYRKTALKPGEWVEALEFDIPSAKERLFLRKSSQRKDLDISCVNAAFRHSSEGTLIALGGVAATPIRLSATETLLKKKKLTAEILPQALEAVQKEITPLSDLRGSSAFRRILIENIFRDFFREVGQ